MKKVLALSLVAVMALVLCSSAFAATGALSVNGALQVSGLDEGDKVSYYQILEWQEDAEGVDGGWKWSNGVDGSAMAAGDLTAITGTTDGSGQISAALAGKIAANLGTAAGTNMSVVGGKWTADVTKAGLYMVIVTPAKAGTMYNPIFVAANWYGAAEGPDSSNSIAVSANELSYSDSGAAKKSTIPLEKTAAGHGTTGLDDNDPYRTDVGEIIDFTVTTKIPKFGANYTDPVFKLVDTLDGLTLTTDPTVLAGSTPLTEGTHYTLTGGNGTAGYTIKFEKSYLDTVAAAGQEITVTYSAEVTDQATKVVNQDNNTVDLYFSNSPNDNYGYGLLRDETNHFTFSIDANLIGWEGAQESSTEAIKVGVDKEGNVIVESKTYFSDPQWTHGALEGAKFKLYKDATCNTLYTNDVFDGNVVSDATGRITIKGLDVGTYYLKEVDAPEGYIKMQDVVEVKIEAEITENVSVEETVDVNGTPTTVTYKTNELKSYTVTIGGTQTSYTIENSKAEVKKTTSSTAAINGGNDHELKNTKGVELPSTGGIGTTIFYVTGLLMVLGAATVLVARRKADAE